MARAKVAVLHTTPQTVLEDYGRLMDLAGMREHLPPQYDTILKINISWHHYFPGCSTTPWQLDGVIRKLRREGYHNLIPAQNRTVVVDPKVGAVRNHLAPVVRKHGIEFVYLYEEGTEWVVYQPKARMRVLPNVFPEGILIPKSFIGKNAIHLPTTKTHVFTGITGAMKNAFGGLLRENRHWTHAVIHETLVDLLAIQQEIHPGLFAVMDGTIAGDGPGPRAMVPHVKNVILASNDQVAIDAIEAKLMGFDPLSFDFIRLAHEDGLGVGDPREIEIVGDDISGENWHFNHKKETLASRGQKLIYHGPLKPLEHLLLRTWIVPWSFLASRLYHDVFWYPFVGKPRVRRMLATEWGDLFRRYGQVETIPAEPSVP
ncbi:MAG: DUF362 domain-containing protein [Armatimonadota bacterium]|jgi:uncharacterized protein (DUF362 family)|nr:DUF362 domain-containing protein [Armatimonadota bacterium]